jgi:Xylose isomerase-like TIM barrel
MMRFSLPFLATDIRQFDPAWAEQGLSAEAVVFNRRDVLSRDRWDTVVANLRQVAAVMPAGHVVFHFPVNDSNYVEDAAVRDRLWASFDLAAELGLAGIVLHANQIRPVREWSANLFERTRDRFGEFASVLAARVRGLPFWVGLENMPIMGNDADELDPTLVFPADFAGLCEGNLGITWDLCHYSYSVHVASLLASGALDEAEHYPAVRDQGLEAFVELAPHIVHWHFSAFRGVARVAGGERCDEGQTPWRSTLGEPTYARLFRRMLELTAVQQVTFEIAEDDYCGERVNARAVMRWCTDLMTTDQSPST